MGWSGYSGKVRKVDLDNIDIETFALEQLVKRHKGKKKFKLNKI